MSLWAVKNEKGEWFDFYDKNFGRVKPATGLQPGTVKMQSALLPNVEAT